jgi:DNA-binding transcriptional regulator YdaS (Cro superfamily)
LTEDEVMERLRAAIAEAGSQRAFAEKHGFTPGYVSDVIKGQRGLSDRILAAIGVERVINYRLKIS